MPVFKALMKITLQEQENLNVFLMSEYGSDEVLRLKMLNLNQNESYIGNASDLDLRTQAARIRMTFKDFFEQTKKALFQSSFINCRFIYSFQKENESYVFKWKNVDHEETIINIGSVQMEKKPFNLLCSDVFISLSEEVFDLKNKIEDYAKELSDCKTQTNVALTRLFELTEIKNNLEKDMFSKFVLVLNEKKRLHDEKKQVKKTNCGTKVFKPNKLDSLSESSEENEKFLDLNDAGPSTSKNNSFSLFEDEDDSVVPVKPSKIRVRNVANKRKSNEEIGTSNRKRDSKKHIIEDEDFLLDNL